jgi:hypothetical protein
MQGFLLDVIKILLTFIVSGLIGNYVLQAWQARNWFAQQRFLGREKEYSALKEIADELATLLANRIFYMSRLRSAISSGSDDQFATAVTQHDDAVRKWNERLTSFYVKLTILISFNFAWRLEQYIQKALVETGAKLEELVRSRNNSQAVTALQTEPLVDELNKIQGQAAKFNEALLQEVLARRTDVYYGARIGFTVQNLRYFSTWKLVKALFVRDVDSLSVLRTPLDP